MALFDARSKRPKSTGRGNCCGMMFGKYVGFRKKLLTATPRARVTAAR